MRLGVELLGRRLLQKRSRCLSNARRAVGREPLEDCQLAEPQRSTGQRAFWSNMRFGGAVLGCGLLRHYWPSPDTGREVARCCDVSIGFALARPLNALVSWTTRGFTRIPQRGPQLLGNLLIGAGWNKFPVSKLVVPDARIIDVGRRTASRIRSAMQLTMRNSIAAHTML